MYMKWLFASSSNIFQNGVFHLRMSELKRIRRFNLSFATARSSHKLAGPFTVFLKDTVFFDRFQVTDNMVFLQSSAHDPKCYSTSGQCQNPRAWWRHPCWERCFEFWDLKNKTIFFFVKTKGPFFGTKLLSLFIPTQFSLSNERIGRIRCIFWKRNTLGGDLQRWPETSDQNGLDFRVLRHCRVGGPRLICYYCFFFFHYL